MELRGAYAFAIASENSVGQRFAGRFAAGLSGDETLGGKSVGTGLGGVVDSGKRFPLESVDVRWISIADASKIREGLTVGERTGGDTDAVGERNYTYPCGLGRRGCKPWLPPSISAFRFELPRLLAPDSLRAKKDAVSIFGSGGTRGRLLDWLGDPAMGTMPGERARGA